MRSLRAFTVAAGLLSLTPLTAMGQANSGATPAKLLEIFKPTKGIEVEYDKPTDPAVINACKVEVLPDATTKHAGYALRDGQGRLLRRFVDTDGNRDLDQWSYYKDGFEVYRELDLDGDRRVDESRWMNSAGTRIAKIQNSKIVSWKRLSAEEAYKILVQSLLASDWTLLETVMASPAELEALGVPQSTVAQAKESGAKRVELATEVVKGLKGWTAQTTWNRLDGLLPHLIPADSSGQLKEDLILYENAVIFPAQTAGQSNDGTLAFLQIPEMLKLGDVWKFVELPKPVDPSKPLVTTDGGIRSALFREQVNVAGAVSQDPEMEAALKALASFDEAHSSNDSKANIAKFHQERIPLLQKAIKVAKTPEDRLVYTKQIVDSLAAAYQTGLFPAGMDSLNKLIEAEGDGALGTYASFRKIFAEFTVKNEEGGNAMAHQKKWVADLKEFVNKYPKAEETPDALLQLASSHEFNAEEDVAKTYYTTLTQSFPDTQEGKKAAGALRRLDLNGQPLEVKGQGLNKQTIDTAQYRGKLVLISFWASWADPVKKDLPDIKKLYQKYHDRGFEIVGVCLDEQLEDATEFLKANPIPWPQIFEPGGLETNPLATSFGIISVPTMILVDQQGKVINRSVRTASELETQLEKVVASKDGVALGAK